MSIAIRTSFSLLCAVVALAACSGSAEGPVASAGPDPSPAGSGDDPSPAGSGDTSPATPGGAPSPTPALADDIEQSVASFRQQLEPTDAASSSASSSYLTLRRDVRRCASPLCGGFFVSRVNRLTTPCADGSRASECYVSELDLSALGLSDEQAALVQSTPEEFVLRGEIIPESTAVGELGRLQVSEAWQGHADAAASGAFLRVTSNGVVCITHPCLSLTAELLNSRLPSVSIAEVDLEGISADTTDGLEQLSEPEGLLVAGWPEIVSGPAGRALGLDASEYFIPLTASPSVCGTRGAPACAEGTFCDFPPESQCGRADGPGVCQPEPEVCPEIFAPVCGCDGTTYDNACFANAAGVSVETEGACEPSEPEEPGQACGSRGLGECAEGSFCSFPPGANCGRADAPGECQPKPEVCDFIYAPVCGCDGQTYGNACTAEAAGVSVESDGACEDVQP